MKGLVAFNMVYLNYTKSLLSAEYVQKKRKPRHGVYPTGF